MLWIIAETCAMLTGHWMGPWVKFEIEESEYARFEASRCRICRAGYVRPQRLSEWSVFAADLDPEP